MKEFENIFEAADTAGREAVSKLDVRPMVVGHAGVFDSKIDQTKPVYYVADGVCGFAWVNIKPGNSKFANWLKKKGLARSDSYYGGVTIWVSEFNQSMQKKEAYAYAFAKVVDEAGVVKQAYASSRMD